MSWISTAAVYAGAYTFLSFCVALVLGRLFRMTGPVDGFDTPEMMEPPRREPATWATPGYRFDEQADHLDQVVAG